MKTLKKFAAIALCVMILLVTLSACGGPSSPNGGSPAKKASGNCDPNQSTACALVIWRYGLMSDPNKIGYFYGLIQGIDHPIVMYVVKGGIVPVDDMTTPPDYQQACVGGGTSSCAVVRQAQQPDGTWGTNGQAMFGKLANGQYFEWQGLYAFSFEPLPFLNLKVIGCPSNGSSVPGC